MFMELSLELRNPSGLQPHMMRTDCRFWFSYPYSSIQSDRIYRR